MIHTPFHRFLGLLLLSTLFAGCASDTVTPPREGPLQRTNLSACTSDGSLFSLFPFNTWPTIYHQFVNAAVSAHFQGSHTKGSNSPFFSNLQCGTSVSNGLVQPSGSLFLIAAQLPPWQDPEHLARLSEQDFGVVLLEFLRVYECALKSHNDFIDINIQKESPPPPTFSALDSERQRREALIAQELILARLALRRILTTLGSLDRLRPLLLDLECIERASLDLRNILGLVAETSTCLPRIWDARGSLRDPS